MSTTRRFFPSLLAFLALPGTVAFAVPMLLAGFDTRLDSFVSLATIPLGIGCLVLLWCVRDFYVTGKGTLAPWAPPTELVVVGLYRWSRNPMYVGVLLIVLGWAIGFHSLGLGLYTVGLAIAFHLRVVLGEEPWLARTHGAQWASYVQAVPRWVW